MACVLSEKLSSKLKEFSVTIFGAGFESVPSCSLDGVDDWLTVVCFGGTEATFLFSLLSSDVIFTSSMTATLDRVDMRRSCFVLSLVLVDVGVALLPGEQVSAFAGVTSLVLRRLCRCAVDGGVRMTLDVCRERLRGAAMGDMT